MGTATIPQALEAGLQYHGAGNLEEAEAVYRQVLAAEPCNPTALHLLGLAEHQRGNHRAAIDLVGRAIQLNPTAGVFYNTLGEAWRCLGQPEWAIACYERAISIDPAFADAYSNLGTIYHGQRKAELAIAAYQKAIEVAPDFAPAYYNLGVVCHDLRQLDQANALYAQAISLRPGLIEAHANLAKSLSQQGRIAEAIQRYRLSLQIRPDHAAIHSSLLMNMEFDPHYDAQAVFEEHQRWSAIHAQRFTSAIRPHANERNPQRRLRIGYVSGDFRDHVVSYLLEPVLARHDHGQFEVTCYSNVAAPDAWTQRLRRHADRWRDITRLSDDEAAEQVRADGIDILVDLSLHMACNRLLVFARKPAPVQVTYLGYNAPTGLGTIDYRLTDRYMESGFGFRVSGFGKGADPKPEARNPIPEMPFPLPQCYWCYRPHAESPAVVEPPALRQGHITFGSTNSFSKVNDGVIAVWSAILRRMPNSRLLIVIDGGAAGNRHVQPAFASQGIAADRLMLVDRCPLDEYLALYRQIDIALDPFPYNGGTTSLDALWMGVPVVSLAGQRPVSRAGKTLLTNLGLAELVAETPEQYVQIACALAGNLERLRALRGDMRQRMRGSPIMDEVGFTRGLERAYRKMWSDWCQASP